MNFKTIPIVTAIFWSFVSIQEIGKFIENPFNKEAQIIALNKVTSLIRADVSGNNYTVFIINSYLTFLSTVQVVSNLVKYYCSYI